MGDFVATSLFSSSSPSSAAVCRQTPTGVCGVSGSGPLLTNSNHHHQQHYVGHHPHHHQQQQHHHHHHQQIGTMQDELLIEKQGGSGKQAPLSPGGLDGGSNQDKSKESSEAEANAMVASTPQSLSSSDKDINSCVNTTGLQGYAEPVRVPSLWAAPPDDTGLHALPVNGSIATFQNFPTGGPAGLFAGSSAGARRAITASHNFHGGNTGNPTGARHGLQVGQQQQQQPQQQQQQQQTTSHPGVYLQGKGYAAWSGGPQAQQQWGGGPQPNAAVSPALSPWSRGRSVPNLPPLHSSLHAAAAVAAAAGLQGRKPSPTFPGHPGANQGHPSNISPVKFRRSTSYPGKGNLYPPQPAPTFEVTAAEERDLLQLPPYQQERMTANGNSPLDSMRTLEHYLSDIMRAGAADTPEHLKDKKTPTMKVLLLSFAALAIISAVNSQRFNPQPTFPNRPPIFRPPPPIRPPIRFRRSPQGSISVDAMKPLGGHDRHSNINIDYNQRVIDNPRTNLDTFGGANINRGHVSPHAGLKFEHQINKDMFVNGHGQVQPGPRGGLSPSFGVGFGYRFRREVQNLEDEAEAEAQEVAEEVY